VTLDDDVVAALRRIERERGVSFKEALNSAIRAGLAGRDAPAAPFTVHTFAAEVQPGVDLTRANRLLADLEDEELARKLDLRK
jgi:hypothetical protein